jgi:glycosyltransferase involved in cell wall biosynthesis
MRVLLVGNYEPDGQESMLRYAAWLDRSLRARGHEITVSAPQVFFPRLTTAGGLKKYLAYVDKFLLFPPQLRRLARQYDLVHVLDHSNSMYLRVVRGRHNLITCHDVLAVRAARGEFPEVSIGLFGRLLQRWILSGLRSARNVLCDSAKTADDIRMLTGATGDRSAPGGLLRVVPIPLNWNYQPRAVLSIELTSRLGLRTGERYILHVGGNQWYKNRVGVLRIFARLIDSDSFSDIKLVMAGKPWTEAIENVIREEHLGDRVIQAPNVTNDELQALYGNAVALLFPSIEEGFGWPILEAQACGCPVITSCRPPMSDVAGEGAILIDPVDARAAARAIADGLANLEGLRAAGFRNLERFNEGAIVDQYCAFYEAILREELGAAR